MNRRFSRLSALIGAGALVLAASVPALAGGHSKLQLVIAPDATGAPDAGKAWVRVLHASPDAPAVDVKANDGNILTGVAFGTISDYLPVDAGTYNIKVCAAGTDTCVIDADLPFADGKKYTVAATNMLKDIEAQVIEDTAGPNADKAQVRVVHFSADTPAVDVLTQDGETAVVSDLAYPKATDYLALDAGSYDLKVCASADNSVCPLDPPALDLAAGSAASVFAVGSLAAATPPDTSTVFEAGETGSSTGIAPFAIILLAVAAIAGALAMNRRLAPRRIRK